MKFEVILNKHYILSILLMSKYYTKIRPLSEYILTYEFFLSKLISSGLVTNFSKICVTVKSADLLPTIL